MARMSRPWFGIVLAASLLGWAAMSFAQATAPAATSPHASAAPPARSTAAVLAVRPAAELRVIEDDQVRIEETRVRGQLQRITVVPKGAEGGTLRPYDIVVGAGGRDPSQDKSAAGQRVWSVLRF
jgi:hypothetical protein